MNKIILNNPLDMHLHLRDYDMLKLVAPLSSKQFSGALIMPNLVPPITTKDMLKDYKKRIQLSTSNDNFEAYMTIFFQLYDKKFLEDIKDDITAIKLYPAGITTNSDGGISSFDIETLRATLEAMSDLNIPLSIHGESDGFVMDRENEFLPIYEKLAVNFPNLKIIMEHITTKEACDMVLKYDNLFATITLHHLLITLDDLAGGLLKPHLFCKPIAKRYEDKKALLFLATSGNDKVMFGSDSAPHPTNKKESCGCAAGIFTAPIALQYLVDIFIKDSFDENQIKTATKNLQKFLSYNAVKIYGIKPTKKQITIVKKPFKIPANYTYGDIVVTPMDANEQINWSIL